MIASVNLRSLSAPKQAARLLTIAEAAHTYKLCAATLRAWTNTGKLPTLRTLGGHRRLRGEDIERLLGVVLEGEGSGCDGGSRDENCGQWSACLQSGNPGPPLPPLISLPLTTRKNG